MAYRSAMSYVRDDREISDQLDFEEDVIRKCLGAVRSEYNRLQGEWLVLLDLFEQCTRADQETAEAKSKRGHEKLERMYTTLKDMRKKKKKKGWPMEIVEVGGVEDIKGMLEEAEGVVKVEHVPQQDIPGTSFESTCTSSAQEQFVDGLDELDEELQENLYQYNAYDDQEDDTDVLSDFETDVHKFMDMDFIGN